MPHSIEQLDARLISLPTEQNPGQPDALPRLARHHAYTKLKIVSNAKGESILFAFDHVAWRMTIWLPDAEPGKWIVYVPEFAGFPGVQDFDVAGNCLEGRNDDTIDLAVLAHNTSLGMRSFYYPALPFSTRLEDWQAYFSKPMDLTPFQPGVTYWILLGLLPKPVRSVFIVAAPQSDAWGATRCDVDQQGNVATYPLDIRPEGPMDYPPIFKPCVAARIPGNLTLDEGLVESYVSIEEPNKGVVRVMLPKTPLGDAWEMSPPPPLNLANWTRVRAINTFLRIDTGEPIITFVMTSTIDSPLTKAVWVMDTYTLTSGQDYWWLAAPADQVFPPAGSMVRALPVQMQAGKPPTWIWLQVGLRKGTDYYSMIESRATEFSDEVAPTQWLAMAHYFDVSLASSSTTPGETTARIFLAQEEIDLGPVTVSLSVATLDNASGQWQYQDVPLPALQVSQG